MERDPQVDELISETRSMRERLENWLSTQSPASENADGQPTPNEPPPPPQSNQETSNGSTATPSPENPSVIDGGELETPMSNRSLATTETPPENPPEPGPNPAVEVNSAPVPDPNQAVQQRRGLPFGRKRRA